MILADDWKPADSLVLEPNAEIAVREKINCIALMAGPGAGKTEMLAQRADFLLKTGSCRYPRRILAISFKVDASSNLRERVQRRCGKELANRFDSHTFHAFAKRIIDRFRLILTGKDALDADFKVGEGRVTHQKLHYDDLIPLAIKIVKNSNLALNAIRQTYSDVFLDEFQDCTDKQYELIKLIFLDTKIRLTAVGDTKQRIMAFAGALEGIFQTYADDFVATPLNLYRNFRSKPRLLRMQNEIIRVIDPKAVMPDNQLEGDEGEIYLWKYKSSQHEAVNIADQIAKWIEHDKIPHSEIAILIRSQVEVYAEHLFSELNKRSIPFRNEAKIQDISVDPIARLIIDYLSCLYGEREPEAWINLMNLIASVNQDDESALRQDFQSFIGKERNKVVVLDLLGEPYKDWWKSVEAFLKKTGTSVLTALAPDSDSLTKIEETIDQTKAYINELLTSEPDLRVVLKKFSDDQAVRILTIHKSKGLEFHTVVIMAVENETFWGDENENRCIFFVAASRSKQRLILTTCEYRVKPTAAKKWSEHRTPYEEFINYTLPYIARGSKLFGISEGVN